LTLAGGAVMIFSPLNIFPSIYGSLNCSMPVYTDQTGHVIALDQIPKRIISLVPSQTELLYDLGLDDEVVGITKFCIHPDSWFHTKTRIGGTKTLNIERISQLHPDLIIANKEENVKEQVEALSRMFPVWTTDVNDLPTAFEMIKSVGEMTGKSAKATEIVTSIRQGFETIQPAAHSLRTAYLIWQEPFMAAGGDTFINAIMQAAGLTNIYSQHSRYPEITINDLNQKKCELLLLSSEPFPFREKHQAQLQRELPGTNVMLVDGEMFSWYGSRLLKAVPYIKKLVASIQ
jgi:ABC-type Fe3+-hydroxamate transport system substrate-binding protein